MQRNTINNRIYPIWDAYIYENPSHYIYDSEFTDPLFQKSINNDIIEKNKLEWIRLLEIPGVFLNNSYDWQSIKQGKTENCSLIAGIIVLLKYSMKFNINLFKDLIFPKKVNLINKLIIINIIGWRNNSKSIRKIWNKNFNKWYPSLCGNRRFFAL